MIGVHTMSADDYHADNVADRPTLSASIACILCNQSPAHARAAHPKLNPDFARTEEPKFDVGQAAHALFLEGEDRVRVVYADKWNTKEAKELRAQARAEGLIPLLERQWDNTQQMVAAVYEQLAARNDDPPLFQGGKPEQTLVWEEDGVLCRARLDWLHNDLAAIDDLKTTSASANPESWSRTLFGIGADIQMAMYQRAVCAVYDRIVPPEFRWVVVETYPPYALSVHTLAPAGIALANAKLDRALAVWKRCLERDEWPAYPTEVAYAEPPAWELLRWEDRAARDEVAA